MKNTIIAVLTTLVSVFIILLIIGTIQSKNDNKSTLQVDSFKTEFMNACSGKDQAKYNYCSCAYSYLENNYSKSEIVQMGIDIDNGITDEGITNAIMSCIDEY